MINDLWLAEPGFLKSFIERIENATADDRKQAEALFDEFVQEKDIPKILTINGDEALIKIEGVLSRTGPSRIARYFGYKGTAYNDIIKSLQIAGDDENVKTIRLIMNTPGGAVDGVDETSQAVAKAAKKKKVIAENHGLMASGGYWIASQATRIIATSPANETGSIGIVFATLDFSKALEQEGIKRVVIVSKNAPNKAPDISKKGGRDIIQERLNALERVFISRIAQGRNVSIEYVQEKFGQGGVLIAQDPDTNIDDALSVGMIDGVESSVIAVIDEEPQAVAQDDSQVATSDDSQINNHTHKETVKMDLKKAIAEHPGIQVEVEAKVQESFKKGVQSATDKMTAMIKKVTAYLGADSTYPAAIKGLALKVLSGESNVDALEGAVAAYDAAKEEKAATQAADETNTQGDTPPEGGGDQISPDGKINNEADFQAAVERTKAQ